MKVKLDEKLQRLLIDFLQRVLSQKEFFGSINNRKLLCKVGFIRPNYLR